MKDISINWRLKKQRYNLIGQKCPICDITLFPPKEICPNCGYKLGTCPECGCRYNRECKHILENDILNTEIGC